MVHVKYERGIYIPEADFWLDPTKKRPFAFVSHAHSDHTRAHEQILATPATAALASARAHIPRGRFLELPYWERREFEIFAATLIPAGHVLGSAQIHLECAGGDLLYTGDFKLRSGLSSEAAGVAHAETLVMETTYGLPHYRFPPSHEVLALVLKFCAEVLEDGEVPILLGYSLGKAQEILSSLHGLGVPIMLHGSIATMAQVYTEFGIPFPEFVEWDAAAAGGHVLICPPAAAGSRALTAIKNRRVAALTGWALDPAANHRMGVDVAFPLSDHADYDDLLAHVVAVAPRRVLTLHGFAREFARDLRARGIEAWALNGPNQLEWAQMASAPPPVCMIGIPPLREGGFEAFAAVCEKIRQTTGKLRMTSILAPYLRGLRPHELRNVATWLTGRAFAPAQGLALNAGWTIIRRSLSQVSRVPEAEIQTLARRTKDPGQTARQVLARSHGPFDAHSIPQVAATFAAMASKGGPLAKTEALVGVLRTMHPAAASALVGLVMGDLRIGLGETLVEEALASAFSSDSSLISVAHTMTGDLGVTASLAADGKLSEAPICLFRPIPWMLATPVADAAAIWAQQGSEGTVWLEPEMGGVGAQLHAGCGRTEIYSRDLRRITVSFPEIAAVPMGEELVCEGVILAWEDGHPRPCADLERNLWPGEDDLFLPRTVPVVFLAYDLLAFEGATLLRKPLSERHELLASLQLPEPLSVTSVTLACSAEEIDAACALARADGHKGILAKQPASTYMPAQRTEGWLKMDGIAGHPDRPF